MLGLTLCAAPVAARDDLPAVPPAVLPVYDMPHPYYDPPRIMLGSFLLAPVLSQVLTYDDNIFASDRFQVGDFISTTTESLTAQSQWSRHSLGVRLYSAQQVYGENANEDANTFGVEARGRLDILADGHFDLAGSFVQQPQRRDSPQAAIATIERPIYNTITGTIGYTQEWGRWRNLVDVGVIQTAYTTRENASRNGIELRYRDRLSLAVGGDVWTFLQASYATQNWLRRGNERNFDTVTLLAGLNTQVAGVVDAELGVGVLRHQYRFQDFDQLVTPSFSSHLTWNIRPLTTVSLSAERTVSGLETFCDRSLSALTCSALAGTSLPQIFDALNVYIGCTSGLCHDNPAAYYGPFLTQIANELDYRLRYSTGPVDLADVFPGVPRNTVSAADGFTVIEELRHLLARQAAGKPVGLFGNQRGTVETIAAEIGVQHEFWHDLLGEARLRFEEDKFAPAGLTNTSYALMLNGRFLVNRNLEMDASYVHSIRVANEDVVLYNSGPYTENTVSLTVRLAL